MSKKTKPTPSMQEAAIRLYSRPNALMQGLKYDTDKTWAPEYLAPEYIYGTSAILAYGAKKYEPRNWEKGMSWSRVFGALMRHMWAWWGGKGPTTMNYVFGNIDSETGHSHLWHASCCLMFLTAYEARGVGEDDRPIVGPVHASSDQVSETSTADRPKTNGRKRR